MHGSSRIFLALIAAAVLIAGCGGSDTKTVTVTTGAEQTLEPDPPPEPAQTRIVRQKAALAALNKKYPTSKYLDRETTRCWRSEQASVGGRKVDEGGTVCDLLWTKPNHFPNGEDATCLTTVAVEYVSPTSNRTRARAGKVSCR